MSGWNDILLLTFNLLVYFRLSSVATNRALGQPPTFTKSWCQVFRRTGICLLIPVYGLVRSIPLTDMDPFIWSFMLLTLVQPMFVPSPEPDPAESQSPILFVISWHSSAWTRVLITGGAFTLCQILVSKVPELAIATATLVNLPFFGHYVPLPSLGLEAFYLTAIVVAVIMKGYLLHRVPGPGRQAFVYHVALCTAYLVALSYLDLLIREMPTVLTTYVSGLTMGNWTGFVGGGAVGAALICFHDYTLAVMDWRCDQVEPESEA